MFKQWCVLGGQKCTHSGFPPCPYQGVLAQCLESSGGSLTMELVLTWMCSWTSNSHVHNSSVSKPRGDTLSLEPGWEGQLPGQEQPQRASPGSVSRGLCSSSQNQTLPLPPAPPAFDRNLIFFPCLKSSLGHLQCACLMPASSVCLPSAPYLQPKSIPSSADSHPTCCENTLRFPSLVPGPTWKPPHLACMLLASLP